MINRGGIDQRKFLFVAIVYILVLQLVHSQSDFSFYSTELLPHYEDAFSFDYEKVTHAVQLGLSSDGVPQHYYANLITPVCDDSICEILHLEVYWDLLGNYIGFDTIPGFALTKYNHIRFTQNEYVRLHEILKDRYSDLGELDMVNLVSNIANQESGIIDAVSGATNIDIANSIVKGGVYSCYILWHIVNPLTKDKILEHTDSLLSPSLRSSMLTSANSAYQMYILKGFSVDDYTNYKEELLLSLSEISSEVLVYLIDHMPDSFLSLEEVQSLLVNNFSSYSVIPRFKLLQRLSACRCVTRLSLEILSNQLEAMSYMQVQEFVDMLDKYPSLVSEIMLRNITQLVRETSYKYSFILEEYLRRLK